MERRFSNSSPGRGLCALLAGAALSGAVAHAQDSADPIGALLSQPEAQTQPAETMPTSPTPAPQSPAAQVPTSPPATDAVPAPVPALPAPATPVPPVAASPPPQAPAPYNPAPARPPYAAWTPPPQVSRRPPVTEPVHIDEAGKTPETAFAPSDAIYDSRLRSSSASAQGLQGPLDGSWTMSSGSGGDIYTFQLVDQGGDILEGAWRDLRRIGALGGSGFLDEVRRYGSQLTLRFSPDSGGAGATATLTAGLDGRWTGEMTDRGQRREVVLRRN